MSEGRKRYHCNSLGNNWLGTQQNPLAWKAKPLPLCRSGLQKAKTANMDRHGTARWNLCESIKPRGITRFDVDSNVTNTHFGGQKSIFHLMRDSVPIIHG